MGEIGRETMDERTTVWFVWRARTACCQGEFKSYEAALRFVKEQAAWNRVSTREFEITDNSSRDNR